MTAMVVSERGDEEGASEGTPSQHWCIVTCEYPPLVGGVSDHTCLLARVLADAGDTADVWCPPWDDDDAVAPPHAGVTLHVLPSRFGMDALQLLRRALVALPADTRLLVQWVPTGYGWRMLNLPFAAMLFSLPGRPLDLYVHEVGWEISRRETTRRALAGVVHRVMTWLAARSARRVFVTIPAWRHHLQLLGVDAIPRDETVTWVPVPSNLPVVADETRVVAIRRHTLRDPKTRVIVGHFGTFGRYHAAILRTTVPQILDDDAERFMLLIGRNGASLRNAIVAVRPDLASRIDATGGLAPAEAAAQIAACDVLVQPYEDGVSTRRGSLMACIALGRPTITNRGPSTEDVWSTGDAVQLTDSDTCEPLAAAVTTLLSDPARRDRLATSARRLHADRFALVHGVALLRGAAIAPATRQG